MPTSISTSISIQNIYFFPLLFHWLCIVCYFRMANATYHYYFIIILIIIIVIFYIRYLHFEYRSPTNIEFIANESDKNAAHCVQCVCTIEFAQLCATNDIIYMGNYYHHYYYCLFQILDDHDILLSCISGMQPDGRT